MRTQFLTVTCVHRKFLNVVNNEPMGFELPSSQIIYVLTPKNNAAVLYYFCGMSNANMINILGIVDKQSAYDRRLLFIAFLSSMSNQLSCPAVFVECVLHYICALIRVEGCFSSSPQSRDSTSLPYNRSTASLTKSLMY